MSRPLLLYSLDEFREVIFEGFRAAGVRTVMEIGSEAGTFTRELVRWVESNDGKLFCVEPKPTEELIGIARHSEHVELVPETSHQALSHLPAVDAYLIDGDHNYFTVNGELEAINRIAREEGRFPLLFLQDVGWPCGRRDFYYNPEVLPREAVRPHTFDLGVVPWSSIPVRGGYRSNAEFAWALEEGGPANGVRTALEDFLVGRDDLHVIHVPCVFGLSIVFAKAAGWSEHLRLALAAYHENELLARLERNRVDLYLKILELQDREVELRLSYEGWLAERDTRMGELETQLANAGQEARAARAEAAALRLDADSLAATVRAWESSSLGRLSVFLSRWAARLGVGSDRRGSDVRRGG